MTIDADEALKLKIKAYIYEVLENRRLTVQEARAIKEALAESLDLIFERQFHKCKDMWQKKIDVLTTAQSTAIASLKTELKTEIKEDLSATIDTKIIEREEAKNKGLRRLLDSFYKIIGILTAIVLTLIALQKAGLI